MNYLDQLERFQKQFSCPVLDTPQIPQDRWKLRIALLQEELDELKAACEAGDAVEALDALVDVGVILFGSVHEFGMGKVFDSAFNEVMESNFSKSCDTLEEAEETQGYYLLDKQVPTYIQQVEDKWNVYRKADHKVLKNINWKKPNLKQFVS